MLCCLGQSYLFIDWKQNSPFFDGFPSEDKAQKERNIRLKSLTNAAWDNLHLLGMNIILNLKHRKLFLLVQLRNRKLPNRININEIFLLLQKRSNK